MLAENSMKVHQKFKIELLYEPTIHRKCTFTATLLPMAKLWKELQCSATEEQIKEIQQDQHKGSLVILCKHQHPVSALIMSQLLYFPCSPLLVVWETSGR